MPSDRLCVALKLRTVAPSRTLLAAVEEFDADHSGLILSRGQQRGVFLSVEVFCIVFVNALFTTQASHLQVRIFGLLVFRMFFCTKCYNLLFLELQWL